jgi:hypothetical protein
MQERCRVEEIKKWGKKTAGNENSSTNDNAYGHCTFSETVAITIMP